MELKEMKMEISFTEITAKANAITVENQPNIIGNASIALRNNLGEFITISGFTVWKSKYEGLNVTPPRDSRSRFNYCLFDKSTWMKITRLILESYDYANMPTVKE